MRIKFFNVILLLIPFFVINSIVSAQPENIKYAYGRYEFSSQYDTANYISLLTVKYDGKQILREEFPEWIEEIKAYDLDGSGRKTVLMQTFSGGAHCCVSTYAWKLYSGMAFITDTLLWGNGGYEIRDMDNDGRMEMDGNNDMFAYAFTNYAETRFIPKIYTVRDGKFSDITEEYPGVIKAYLTTLMSDLKEWTTNGFECSPKGEDTFNTDAGSVKTILAAIVGCYGLLGETEKGYKTVDESYRCPDKEEYKNTLKKDFGLK